MTLAQVPGVHAVFLLGNMLRSNAPGPSIREPSRRALVPGVVLLSYTAVVSAVVWALQAQPDELDEPALPIVIWTGLSLFQGVFLGLIAQGRAGAHDG